MVRRLPPLLALVDGFDLRKIQIIDQVADKVCQVIFRQPLPKLGRIKNS
jgi:hypothetical protein